MNYQQFKIRYNFDGAKVLGKGKFGTVFQCFDEFENQEVAIKRAPVTYDAAGAELGTLMEEYKLAKTLGLHPNIAVYKDCQRFTVENEPMDFAVMQLYRDGNLDGFLVNKQLNGEALTEREIWQLVRGILQGVMFLHEHKIFHRDLNPPNILITKVPQGYYKPLISDFGVSRAVGDYMKDSYILLNNNAGKLCWMSPEAVRRDNKLRFNVDLWSVGLIVYYIFRIENPFKTEQDVNRGFDFRLLKEIPSPYKEIIADCLESDPTKRVKHAALLLELLGEEPTDEETAYQRAMQQNDAEGFRRFLQKFPQGRHRLDAEKHVGSLLEEEAYTSILKEKRWKEKLELIARFLTEYPKSVHQEALQEQLHRCELELNIDYLAGKPDASKIVSLKSEYHSLLDQWQDGLHDPMSHPHIRAFKAVEDRLKAAIYKAIADHSRKAEIEEELAWRDVRSQYSVREIRHYIQHFPKGKYLAKVKAMLESTISERDDNEFRNTQRENTVAAYKQYLAQFPTGKHAADARLFLNKLASASRDETILRDADDIAWETAKNEKTEQAYKSYLDAWPIGKYAPDAARHISQLLRQQKEAGEHDGTTIINAGGKMQTDFTRTARPIKRSWLYGVAGAAILMLGFLGVGTLRNKEAKGTVAPTDTAITSDPFEGQMVHLASAGNQPIGDEKYWRAGLALKPETVAILGFDMLSHEVTEYQWKLVMDGLDFPKTPQDTSDKFYTPVTGKSWDDVQEFLQRLNMRTQKSYRLPTEKEWEYAARMNNPDFSTYTKKEIESAAWTKENSAGRIHSTGLKGHSAIGLDDILGNAYEWCSTPYNGDTIVIRGGSFAHPATAALPVVRNYELKSKASPSIGFRIVK